MWVPCQREVSVTYMYFYHFEHFSWYNKNITVTNLNIVILFLIPLTNGYMSDKLLIEKKYMKILYWQPMPSHLDPKNPA